MGRMINGVLGLSEKDEYDKVVIDPTQITIGLPKS